VALGTAAGALDDQRLWPVHRYVRRFGAHGDNYEVKIYLLKSTALVGAAILLVGASTSVSVTVGGGTTPTINETFAG